MSDKFALDIRRFAEKCGSKANLVVRKVIMEIGTRVVLRSPVGDPSQWQNSAPPGYTGGHFRANWQYAESSMPQGILPDIDKTGRVSIDRVKQVKPQAFGKVHYIVNNLPYAQRLETGWSKQAPGGMVGLVIAEFQAIVRQANKELR
jgi:hypothetical protein